LSLDERRPGRGGVLGTWLLALMLALGGAGVTHAQPDPSPAPFHLPADGFAFANETVWEYEIDPVTGTVTSHTREHEPEFSLRCGTMARAARQFFAAARFDPSAPPVDADAYARLVHAVLETDPRDPPAERVLIPGYEDLRTFSAAHEALLKRAMGGPWTSYMQRGNWRMIFPFTPRHQRGVASRLLGELAQGRPPIVHLVRFPQLTINHLVVVFQAEEDPAAIRFRVYDPNDAGKPLELTYDRAAEAFSYAATAFFPGGPVRAYEVYDGWLY